MSDSEHSKDALNVLEIMILMLTRHSTAWDSIGTVEKFPSYPMT